MNWFNCNLLNVGIVENNRSRSRWSNPDNYRESTGHLITPWRDFVSIMEKLNHESSILRWSALTYGIN